MDLSTQEIKLFQKLNTSLKIQDYLDGLKINFEPKGDTCFSPRMVMKSKRAHCIEAALFAYAVMLYHRQKPLLLDLQANNKDYDHVVCLFKQNGKWGAISKSNHATIRYRDPIYDSVRELAMSYFHEYTNEKGEKTLRAYSIPISLKKYGKTWITAQEDLWQIAYDLDEFKHFPILPKSFKPRRADKMERKAGNLVEYKK